MKLRSFVIRMASGVSLIVLLGSSSVAFAQATIDGGATVTVPGTESSPWNVGGDLTVGDVGTGTLLVENGGIVSNIYGYIGKNSGSTGSVTVSGAGSQWNNSDNLYVGVSGTGTLLVENGGIVSSKNGIIGSESGSTSSVTVRGAGSQWNNSGYLYVGGFGTGTLLVENGGIVSNINGHIGFQSGGNGSVTVSGAGSQWNNSGNLYVGLFGTGTLLVENGGIVSNPHGYIGNDSGGTGSVTVSGAGSKWINSGNLRVGDMGTGTLLVENGGIVSSVGGYIGSQSGGIGSVTVRGAGSQWNSGTLDVGEAGTGTLLVENGGIVSSAYGYIGYRSGVTGSMTVRGAGSQWNSSDLIVGHYGTGTLLVENGGIVSSDDGIIGNGSGGTGSVTVSGAGSQWNNSGNLLVGRFGTGTLLVENGGMVQAAFVEIGSVAGLSGIVAIGGLSGSSPSAPGTIAASAIVFGAGDGHIVFNHTSSSYVFDATINGGLDNGAGSGTGLVGDGVIEAISGRTILNAYHGDFTGTLQVRDGGILQINHDMTHVTTQILPGGILEGRGVVSNLVNSGILAPGGSIGTLTVFGNYTGNGGALHIEAVLGGDNSPTDLLVITGDVFGTTPVVVTNLGGHGAETINGIRIIEIGGVSSGNAFTLRGDYVTADGQQAVVGGAYAYTLRHNSEADPNDGNWYLTSETTLIDPDTGLPIIDPETGLPEEGPRYQAGVPLYEQYPQVLASLNTVPTLQQRVGNTYWSPSGAIAADNTPGTYGMWGRIEGTRTASDPARSTSHAHRDTDLWKLQTGFDFGLHQSAEGALIGGVNISHGTALAEIASPYGRGKIDATGTGIGATLTWYGSGGFYVDGLCCTN